MRWSSLAERELAEAREAHWWALAAAAALEEQIERLSQPTTRDRPDAHVHSQSCNWQRRRSWGWSRGCCRALPEDSPVPLGGTLGHWRTKGLNHPSWSLTWGLHWSWGQMLSVSSQSWPPYKRRAGDVIPPQSLQWRIMRNGRIVEPLHLHTQLVEGTCRNPRHRWLLGACLENKGFLWNSPGEDQSSGWR